MLIVKKSEDYIGKFAKKYFFYKADDHVTYILDRHHPSDGHHPTSLRCIDIKDKGGTISIPRTMISIPKHNKKIYANSKFKSEVSKSQQMYLLATKSIRISDNPYFQSPEKQIREELSGDSIEEISERQIERHLALNQNIYGNMLRDMRDVPIISTGKYLAHPSKSEIGISKDNLILDGIKLCGCP